MIVRVSARPPAAVPSISSRQMRGQALPDWSLLGPGSWVFGSTSLCAVSPEARPRCTSADPYADVMKQAGISVPVVTYATKDRDADVLAEKVKMTAWETDILIRTPLGRMQVGTDKGF